MTSSMGTINAHPWGAGAILIEPSRSVAALADPHLPPVVGRVGRSVSTTDPSKVESSHVPQPQGRRDGSAGDRGRCPPRTRKTGAVRELARQRLTELEGADEVEIEERRARVVQWLEREVWPRTADLRPLSKEEEEDLLGYDEPIG